MLVSKPTYGGGAPLGIDLEAGVAKITLPARPVEAGSALEDEVGPSTATDDSSADSKDAAEDA